MGEEIFGHSSLDLKKEHVELLFKYLIPAVTAQKIVNDNGDNARPSIKSIVSFTLPADFLPAYPRTFGDVGKSFETIGKLGDTKFDYLRTNDRGVSMLAMRMWIMIVVMMTIISDEKAGSVPHVDAYKQEMDRRERKKQEEEQKKKAKNKELVENEDDSKNAGEKEKEKDDELKTGKDENTDPNNEGDKPPEDGGKDDGGDVIAEDPVSELDSVQNEELNLEDFMESITTDENVPKTNEDKDSVPETKTQKESSKEKNGKGKGKKKKSIVSKKGGTKAVDSLERVQKGKSEHGAGAETASSNLGSTEEDIRRSRVKTSDDTSCISHFEYLSNAKKGRDMRGRICKLSGEFLTFLYNGKRYPKVYTFIEELEGHVEMPIEKTRITLDGQLYNHPDGIYSGLTKEEEDSLSGKGAVGNGKIVGYRFWFMVMDKSFSLVQQLRRMLSDKETYDVLRKGPNFESCPIDIFSKALDEVKTESDLFSKTCVPLLSFGSGFKNVTEDPIIQNITQLTKGVFSAEEMMNEREREIKEDRTDESGSKYHRYSEAPTKYSYNKNKDLDVSDFMSHRTAFSEFMGSVCDIQRSPEQYFKIPKLQSSQNRKIITSKQPRLYQPPSSLNSKTSSDTGTILPFSSDPRPIVSSEPKNSEDAMDTFDLGREFVVSDSSGPQDSSKNYDSVVIEDVIEEEEGTSGSQSPKSMGHQKGSSSQEDLDDLVKVNRDEFQKSEAGDYLAGYKTREEYEFRLREIYDMMQHVNPDQFTGFPLPQRVMFVNSLCTGINFCNVPLPHVMMDTYYHDKKKVVLEAQYKIHETATKAEQEASGHNGTNELDKNEDMDVLSSLNNSSSDVTSSSTEPLYNGLDKMEQVIELMFSAKTKLFTDEENSFRQDGGDMGMDEDSEEGRDTATHSKKAKPFQNNSFLTNMQRLWYQIENRKMNVGAYVSIRDISPTSTYEFVKQAERISDSFKSVSQNVTMEALGLLFGQKLLSVKTPADVEFFSSEQFDPNFPECRNGEISLSELLQFGQKNALLALRIKRYVYLSLIKNRYPDMGEKYKRALAEHNRDYFQKFCHVMRTGANLCSSQTGAMAWWTGQARLGRLFASVPMNYANLSIFGNAIQFLRGVWSGVCLGRNNVDLFLLEMACYWTALEYNWGLRNHLIVSAEHTASKSFTMTAVQSLALEKTFVKTTYETTKAMFIDQDEYQRVDAYDEIPIVLISDVNTAGKGGKGDSEASEAVRVNKEVMAHGRFTMRTNTYEKLADGTILRKNTNSMAVNQGLKIGNNNVRTSDRDSPKMQRVLCFTLAKKDGSYYQASPDEASRDGGETAAKLLGGGDKKHGMRANQQDFAKISLPNKDYIGPDEAHTKGVIRLVHYYMFLTQCLIFAGLLEEPSLDVAERLMVAILEEYTKQKHIKSVISRKMLQFLNWVKAFICLDGVVTTLFTDVFHQHLKYEKVVVVEQKDQSGNSGQFPSSSSSSPTTEFTDPIGYKKTCRRQKDYLNVEEFCESIQKHMHAKIEHVVMACTMAEPFICDQYEPNILNCIASRAYWPIGNIQYIRKVNILEPGKNNCRINEWVFDPRYITVYGPRDMDITYAVYVQMQEELGMTVSQNDVARVLDQLTNKLQDACACLLISRDQWTTNKLNLAKKDEADNRLSAKLKSGILISSLVANIDQTGSSSSSSSSKSKKWEDGTQNSTLSEEELLLLRNNNSSSSSGSKSPEPVPSLVPTSDGDNTNTGSKKQQSSKKGLSKEEKRRILIEESQRKLNEQYDEQSERNAKRTFIRVIRNGRPGKCFQPWDIDRMQEWFLRKYDTYDEMIQDISTSEETQKQCGIVSYQVFKGGEYFWMRFDRAVVDSETVPVARKDGTDGKGDIKQRRYSLLIEHIQTSPRNTMENAIKTVLNRCSAVPPGLNVYMSARTLVGLNQDTGKEEASAYLNQAIEIEHGTKVLYFVAPKAGSTDDEKYLFTDEQLDNMDYFKIPKYDREGNLIKQPDFPNLSRRKRSSLRTDEDYYYGKLAETLKKQQELNSFVDPSRMTVHQINDAIVKIISSSKGVKMENITLDFFGQLRHWFRCGIDPREQIELVAVSQGGQKNARMTSLAELYSSHFMNMTIQDMILEKARVRKSLGRDPCIVTNYPTSLWVNEYKANIEKSRLTQNSCMDIGTMFTQVMGMQNGPNTNSKNGPKIGMMPTGVTSKQLSQYNPFSLSFVTGGTGPSLDEWTFSKKFKRMGTIHLPTQITMAIQANEKYMEDRNKNKTGKGEDHQKEESGNDPGKEDDKSKRMATLPGSVYSSHLAMHQLYYGGRLAKIEKQEKSISKAFFADVPLKRKDFDAAQVAAIADGFEVPYNVKPKLKSPKRSDGKTFSLSKLIKKRPHEEISPDDGDDESLDSSNSLDEKKDEKTNAPKTKRRKINMDEEEKEKEENNVIEDQDIDHGPVDLNEEDILLDDIDFDSNEPVPLEEDGDGDVTF